MKPLSRWSLAWLFCVVCAGPPARAALQPGTIAVYSDGRVVRLLGEDGGGTVWEDARLRRIRYAANPILPPRQRMGLDGRMQYQETLDKGNPGSLLQAAAGTSVEFSTRRIGAKGKASSRNYLCTALGEDHRRILGRDERVRRFRCERFTVHKKFWTRKVKEIRELSYSPRLHMVVEQVRQRPDKGRRHERRLVALIPADSYRYADLRALLDAQREGKAR